MNKEKDYAVIVSVFSAAIALTCFGIMIFHNFDQNGVVELDTFVGIGVALIGICATLIVGLQILNYIEFKDAKNKIKELETINSRIAGMNIFHETIMRESNVQLSNVFIQLSKEMENKDKINMYVSSITLTGIGNPNYRATICADDHDTVVLEERYKYIQDMLFEI